EEGSGVILFVVGNKIDLASNRVVSEAQGQAEADRHGATFIETSAKEGTNVKGLFRQIALALPVETHTPEARNGGLNIGSPGTGHREVVVGDKYVDNAGCGC
ncbi:small GTPase superfamily, Rab type, partial [Kipferlia bialata]